MEQKIRPKRCSASNWPGRFFPKAGRRQRSGCATSLGDNFLTIRLAERTVYLPERFPKADFPDRPTRRTSSHQELLFLLCPNACDEAARRAQHSARPVSKFPPLSRHATDWPSSVILRRTCRTQPRTRGSSRQSVPDQAARRFRSQDRSSL